MADSKDIKNRIRKAMKIADKCEVWKRKNLERYREKDMAI